MLFYGQKLSGSRIGLALIPKIKGVIMDYFNRIISIGSLVSSATDAPHFMRQDFGQSFSARTVN